MRIASANFGQSAYRYNKQHNNKVATAVERLASGLKINKAADDPSGLTMSRKMRAQLELLKTRSENITMESAALDNEDSLLGSVQDLLHRMNELAVRASDGGMDADRNALDAEYQELLEELDAISESSSKNSPGRMISFGDEKTKGSPQEDPNAITIKGDNYDAFLSALENYLLDVTESKDKLELKPSDLQQAAADFAAKNGEEYLNKEAGASGTEFVVTISEGNIYMSSGGTPSVEELGLKDTNLLSVENANEALGKVKGAMDSVSLERTHVGVAKNRLDRTQELIDELIANIEAALSSIEDADMAEEMINYTREQMLTQTSAFVMIKERMRAESIVSMIVE